MSHIPDDVMWAIIDKLDKRSFDTEKHVVELKKSFEYQSEKVEKLIKSDEEKGKSLSKIEGILSDISKKVNSKSNIAEWFRVNSFRIFLILIPLFILIANYLYTLPSPEQLEFLSGIAEEQGID